MDKLELADKVEALDGPCPYLGLDVLKALGKRSADDIGLPLNSECPTASIDAAMTLVPDDIKMSVQQRRSYEPFWIGLYHIGDTKACSGKHRNFALALTAAALRAQHGDGHVS